MKRQIIAAALLLSLALCGCSGPSKPADSPAESQTAGSASAESEPKAPAETGTAKSAAPTKSEVYAARERALEGMTERQISDLTEFVKRANLWLEDQYVYRNFFERLENRDDPEWNYFHQTGEIQIGWAYDGDRKLDEVCESEGLTEAEFYEKYGTAVRAENRYDADGFASALASLTESVQNEALRAVLQSAAEESLLARDTHDAAHVINLYYTLHDLDYFLLRYGREDVGPYVTDTSTISKYYGTLSCYYR